MRERMRVGGRMGVAVTLAFAMHVAGAAAADEGLGERPSFRMDEYALSSRAVAKVNVANGNLFVREVDTDYPDTDYELEVGRVYNSLATVRRTSLADRWVHSLSEIDVSLKENTDGSVTYYRADGRIVRFAPKAGGGYSPATAENLGLTLSGGTFTVTDLGTGDVAEYVSRQGGMAGAVRRTDGNYSLDLRNSFNQVIDSMGRTINVFVADRGIETLTRVGGVTFGYDQRPEEGNGVKQLRIVNGPSLAWSSHYGYDAANNLTSIDTGGVELRFTYDSTRRVKTVTRVSGTSTQTWTYVYLTGSTQRTDPSGRVETTTHTSDLTVTTVTTGGGPPTLARSGSLYAAQGTTLNLDTVYQLGFTTSDPNGLARVDIAVDGSGIEDWEVDCLTGCGTVSDSVPFDPGDYLPGLHTVSIFATDLAGDRIERRFKVTVPAGSEVDVPVPNDTEPGPEDETPLTGELCDQEFGAGSVYCAATPAETATLAATSAVSWGIADPDSRNLESSDSGSPTYLNDTRFLALKVKRVRALLPWNVVRWPKRKKAFARFYRTARDRGLQITVSFQFGCDTDLDDPNGSSCFKQKNYDYAPRKKEYVSATRDFAKTFRQVRYYSAFNEPNHRFQPTRRKISGPGRAALYTYLLERHVCSLAPASNPCTVIAGEFAQDAGGFIRYVRDYRDSLAGRFNDNVARTHEPDIWALHPYRDVKLEDKDRRDTGTSALLRRMPSGKNLWLTEVGSRVDALDTANGTRRNSPQTQAREVRYLTDTLAPFWQRITRVYYYELCQSSPSDRFKFDSGLLAAPAVGDPAGCASTRPAYDAYKTATLSHPNG